MRGQRFKTCVNSTYLSKNLLLRTGTGTQRALSHRNYAGHGDMTTANPLITNLVQHSSTRLCPMSEFLKQVMKALGKVGRYALGKRVLPGLRSLSQILQRLSVVGTSVCKNSYYFSGRHDVVRALELHWMQN